MLVCVLLLRILKRVQDLVSVGNKWNGMGFTFNGMERRVQFWVRSWRCCYKPPLPSGTPQRRVFKNCSDAKWNGIVMKLDYSLFNNVGLNEYILMELNEWATLTERLQYWLRHYQQRICKKGWRSWNEFRTGKNCDTKVPAVTSRRAKINKLRFAPNKNIFYLIGVWGQKKAASDDWPGTGESI